MIRQIKRYLAIRSYVRRLSQDLVRRFGKKSFYPIEEVTGAVERGKFSKVFIAYAHAAFCSENDFDVYYEPLRVSCNYQGLRRTIAMRYLSGNTDFDAMTVFNLFRTDEDQGHFYESGLGK